jgi:hypothetical protein
VTDLCLRVKGLELRVEGFGFRLGFGVQGLRVRV